MKHLYAPWRRSYAYDAEKKRGLQAPQCVFCQFASSPEDDEVNFVIKRFKHVFVVLNLYPYNGGHLLVVPYKHTGSLVKLDSKERAELIESSALAMEKLQHQLMPDGFNMGINSGGRAAGGSIPEHLHMHVLPRWDGDTSFLPTLADTKPISENLMLLYKQLKKIF